MAARQIRITTDDGAAEVVSVGQYAVAKAAAAEGLDLNNSAAATLATVHAAWEKLGRPLGDCEAWFDSLKDLELVELPEPGKDS